MAAGLDLGKYGLHSLRAGGTTAAAAEKVPERLLNAARWMEKRGNTQLCGGIIGASATTIESSKSGLRPKDNYALCLVLPAWQVCCVVCCTEVEGWGVETVTGWRAGREMTLLCG